MNTLAYIIIGLIAGFLITAATASLALMVWIAYQQKLALDLWQASYLKSSIRANSLMDTLRRDVTTALAGMDANRLHDSSIAIQHASKRLDGAVSALNKVIFAAGMGDAGMALTSADLDEMQDQATPGRQVVQYQPDFRKGGFGMPPASGGQYPTVAANSPDPFAEWKLRQQQAGEQQSGASFSAASAGPLPDLDAAFDEDLNDPNVMSDANLGAVPGMTEKLEE